MNYQSSSFELGGGGGGSGVEMENFEIVKKENFLLYANDFAISC